VSPAQWPPIFNPPTFEVVATNLTGQDFTEVVLAFNRYSNPISEVHPRAPFLNGQQQSWSVYNCWDVHLYAIGLLDGGLLEFNTGNIDPDDCNENVCFPPLSRH
jgi:hypothetical protein